MFRFAEKFASTTDPGFDALKTVADAALTGIGELGQLNFETARVLADRIPRHVSASSAVRDLPASVALQMAMTTAVLGQTLDYSRRAYGIYWRSWSAPAEFFGNRVATMGEEVFQAIAWSQHRAQQSAEFAIAAAKSAVSTTALAHGTSSQGARQSA